MAIPEQASLVPARTALVKAARGLVKSYKIRRAAGLESARERPVRRHQKPEHLQARIEPPLTITSRGNQKPLGHRPGGNTASIAELRTIGHSTSAPQAILKRRAKAVVYSLQLFLDRLGRRGPLVLLPAGLQFGSLARSHAARTHNPLKSKGLGTRNRCSFCA